MSNEQRVYIVKEVDDDKFYKVPATSMEDAIAKAQNNDSSLTELTKEEIQQGWSGYYGIEPISLVAQFDPLSTD